MKTFKRITANSRFEIYRQIDKVGGKKMKDSFQALDKGTGKRFPIDRSEIKDYSRGMK